MRTRLLFLWCISVACILAVCIRHGAQRERFRSDEPFGAIDVAYYINLDRRTDRKGEFLDGMRAVGFPGAKLVRVAAVDMPGRGDLGCSRSHIKALELFLASPHRTCAVFEDDFSWTQGAPAAALEHLSEDNVAFDVCMLSSNTVAAEPTPYPYLKRVSEAQTASGYMVSRPFAAALLRNFREGSDLLEKSYEAGAPNGPDYAIDQYWKRLQPGSDWYVFEPRLGKQRSSYSDIQGGVVSYEVFAPEESVKMVTNLNDQTVRDKIVKSNRAHDISVPPVPPGTREPHDVPAKIHFIWVGAPITEKYIRNVERFARVNVAEGYNVYLWTDRPESTAAQGVTVVDVRQLMDTSVNRGMMATEQNMGALADMLRYEIVFQEGGIYTDVDAICMRPYERGVFKRPFVSHTFEPYNNISNAVFGFPVGSRFLGVVIGSLPAAAHRGDVPSRTGPVLFTQCFVAFANSDIQMIHQSILISGTHQRAYTRHTMDANWLR